MNMLKRIWEAIKKVLKYEARMEVEKAFSDFNKILDEYSKEWVEEEPWHCYDYYNERWDSYASPHDVWLKRRKTL